MHGKVVIIGSGPAGLAAALYAARARLAPLLLRGEELGGLLATTSIVENYPGVPEGLAGFELAERMELQAERCGARVVDAVVERVDLSRRPFALATTLGEVAAEALIVATGAAPRKLGVPGEERLATHGVSYCATCDGPSVAGRRVVVVGGGDGALDGGLFLARYASEVVFVHRRDRLRAGLALRERARAEPKARFLWDTVVVEILGDEEVAGVRLRDARTGAEATLAAGAVFPFIGHQPGSDLFRGQLVLDQDGYVVTDGRTHTSVPGVFAAGDVADPIYRQAVTAAATGSMAAMEAARYLAEQARAGIAGSAAPGANLDRAARAS